MSEDTLKAPLLSVEVEEAIQGTFQSVNEAVNEAVLTVSFIQQNDHIIVQLRPSRTSLSSPAVPLSPRQPTIKICRICFEEEAEVSCERDPDNPLISPCLCDGGSKYVHRKCLKEWRENGRSDTFFQCEVCHYCYSFQRQRFAELLTNKWIVYTTFMCVLLSSCWILGFIDVIPGLIEVPADVADSLWMHMLNGAVMLAVFGFFSATIVLCTVDEPYVQVFLCPLVSLSLLAQMKIMYTHCGFILFMVLLAVLFGAGFVVAAALAFFCVLQLFVLLLNRASYIVENV
jgi:hypothetical protein